MNAQDIILVLTCVATVVIPAVTWAATSIIKAQQREAEKTRQHAELLHSQPRYTSVSVGQTGAGIPGPLRER